MLLCHIIELMLLIARNWVKSYCTLAGGLRVDRSIKFLSIPSKEHLMAYRRDVGTDVGYVGLDDAAHHCEDSEFVSIRGRSAESLVKEPEAVNRYACRPMR